MLLQADNDMKRAHIKQTEEDDPQGARSLYLVVSNHLERDDRRYAICLQQAGVCSKMLREFDAALVYLRQALAATVLPWLMAAIRRDMADVHRLMGDLNQAREVLDEALGGLNETEYPEQYGITLSWIGRVERDKGYHGSALSYFERAHGILHGGSDRKLELYNLLDLADGRCKCHHPFMGRQAAHQAYKLARAHGSRTEAGRALLIMVLGHDAQPIIKAVAQRKGR